MGLESGTIHPIVTGLDARECFEQFAVMFGELAHLHCSGRYDDALRQRANVWWAAYRELHAIPAVAMTTTAG